MSNEAEKPKDAAVAWEGDSREVLGGFPETARQNLGFQLWQLQQGENQVITGRYLRLARAFLSCESKMNEPGIASFTYRG